MEYMEGKTASLHGIHGMYDCKLDERLAIYQTAILEGIPSQPGGPQGAGGYQSEHSIIRKERNKQGMKQNRAETGEAMN